MGSKWKKAKVALGLNLCMFVPRTLDDDSPPHPVVSERLSDAALLSPANWSTSSSRPTTPVSSFHGLKLSKSSSKSSKGPSCKGGMLRDQNAILVVRFLVLIWYGAVLS
ncbi:hypothetical protein JHK85_029455 [Glycine max]|nr:hypothetical protein JHK85_029455 [Glycine max]